MRYCHENIDGTIDIMLHYARDWGVDGPDIAREAYKWLAPYWSEQIDPQVFQRLLNNAAEKRQKTVGTLPDVLETRFYDEALRALEKQ